MFVNTKSANREVMRQFRHLAINAATDHHNPSQY